MLLYRTARANYFIFTIALFGRNFLNVATNCLSLSSVMRLSGCAGLRAVRSREHPRLAFVTVILSGINPPSRKRHLVRTACHLRYLTAVHRLSDYHLDAIEHGLLAVLGAIMRNIFVTWRIVLSRAFVRSNALNEAARLFAHAGSWRMRIETRDWIDLLLRLVKCLMKNRVRSNSENRPICGQ